jgi:hypothetical protein
MGMNSTQRSEGTNNGLKSFLKQYKCRLTSLFKKTFEYQRYSDFFGDMEVGTRRTKFAFRWPPIIDDLCKRYNRYAVDKFKAQMALMLCYEVKTVLNLSGEVMGWNVSYVSGLVNSAVSEDRDVVTETHGDLEIDLGEDINRSKTYFVDKNGLCQCQYYTNMGIQCRHVCACCQSLNNNFYAFGPPIHNYWKLMEDDSPSIDDAHVQNNATFKSGNAPCHSCTVPQWEFNF